MEYKFLADDFKSGRNVVVLAFWWFSALLLFFMDTSLFYMLYAALSGYVIGEKLYIECRLGLFLR